MAKSEGKAPVTMSTTMATLVGMAGPSSGTLQKVGCPTCGREKYHKIRDCNIMEVSMLDGRD